MVCIMQMFKMLARRQLVVLMSVNVWCTFFSKMKICSVFEMKSMPADILILPNDAADISIELFPIELIVTACVCFDLPCYVFDF